MPTTLYSSKVDPSEISTPKTVTETLELARRVVHRVSDDPADNGYGSVPSSKALRDGLLALEHLINQIDPDQQAFRDTTVITNQLLEAHFVEDGSWDISEWTIHGQQAHFIGTTDHNRPNSVGVPNSVITHKGHYFWTFEIVRIDTGALELQDAQGNVLKTFTDVGKKFNALEVTYPESDVFRLVAKGVHENTIITIANSSFHHVTTRFYDYLAMMVPALTDPATGGIASVEYVDQQDSAIRHELITMIEAITGGVDLSVLQAHVDSRMNPHGVNCDQINAAYRDHTHTPGEIGAANQHHLHSPEDCNAAPYNHTHTAAEVGAAPETHQHSIGDIINLSIELLNLGYRIDDHSSAQNPHNITPELIGAARENHGHANYVLKTELSSSRVSVRPSPTSVPVGFLPDRLQATRLNLPVFSIKKRGIDHRADYLFDANSGMVSGNISALEDFPLQQAFRQVTSETEPLDEFVAGFASSSDVLTQPVMIQYKPQLPLDITSFEIYTKDPTEGFPVSWSLYFDGTLMEEVVDYDWNQGRYVYTPVISPKTVNLITVVVDKVLRDTSDQWFIGFDAREDLKPAMYIPRDLEYVASHDLNGIEKVEVLDNIEVPLGDYNGTPHYIYAFNNGSDVEVGVTPIAPEYGPVRRGVDCMIDEFYSNSHVVWGDVSVDTGTDPYKLYVQDDAQYWESNPGANSAIIEHTFHGSGFSVLGFRLEFLLSDVEENLVPDEFRVDLLDENDVVLQSQKVSRYIPDVVNVYTQNRVVYEGKFSLLVEQLVKKIRLTVVANNGQPKIRIRDVIWKLTNDFVNSIDKLCRGADWQVNNRTYLGSIIQYGEYPDANYVCYPVGVGYVTHVPVNNAAKCTVGATYKVPNPYLTNNVSTELLAIESSGMIGPIAEVSKVGRDYIEVYTQSEDVFGLKIVLND